MTDAEPEVAREPLGDAGNVVWSALPARPSSMTRAGVLWPLITLVCLLQAVLALFRDGWTAALSLLWLVVAVIAAVSAVKVWRARVRLRPDGVEVRELRTSLYPWTTLVAVYNDGASHALALRYLDEGDGTDQDGRVERVTFLPVPFRHGLFRRRVNPAFVDGPSLISAGWQRFAPAPE